MKELLSTLNEIYVKNSFSTRKNFKIEKIDIFNVDISLIEYGKKVRKVNNKEFLIKSNEILVHFIPNYIKENLSSKLYKKSIKKMLKDNNLLLKFLTHKELLDYTGFSIDVFINDIKKDISDLRFMFNNSYELYIKMPNIGDIYSLSIFEKAVRSHLRYIKSNVNNIPSPYGGSNNYLLFINGLLKTTYTQNDNSTVINATSGSIIEVIRFDRDFVLKEVVSDKKYYMIDHGYEFDISSIGIFLTNGKLISTGISQKTKNIIEFDSTTDGKYIIFPNIIKPYHNEENMISEYIHAFGLESLMTKLNDSGLNLSLLEYLNIVDTLNEQDAFNISISRYRNMNHPDDLNHIDKTLYDEFINSSFKNILMRYNPNLYGVYLSKLIPKDDNILFNTNIYLNRKIIYRSNFSSGDISDWTAYRGGSVILSWFNNRRYLKRITNSHPSGAYKILDESTIDYMITFNFMIGTDTDIFKLVVGLVDSSFNGNVVSLDSSSISIQGVANGEIIEDTALIKPNSMEFSVNKVYTLKLMKNIKSYEIFIYEGDVSEENSFAIDENLHYEMRIPNDSSIVSDRLLIQGNDGILYDNFQIRNTSVIDQTLPIKTSLSIDTVPFTLELPNVNHIIDEPSYVFTIQSNKYMENSYVATCIDGIRVSSSLQSTLLNYDEKYGIQNFFTLLIQKNIFSLQGKEKVEIEFLNKSSHFIVAEYLYESLEPVEFSTVPVEKELTGPSEAVYLVDINGDYILDIDGNYIVTNQFGTNVNNYRIYKNGRYISRRFYTITYEDGYNLFNLDFHIEYQDIITIEYLFYGSKEIHNEDVIDSTSICRVTNHKYPLTPTYYDFYLNGRKLYSDQIVNLSKDTFYIKNIKTKLNLDIVEKDSLINKLSEYNTDINGIEIGEKEFNDSYDNTYDIIDEHFDTKTKEEISEEIKDEHPNPYIGVEEDEFDNIDYSYNILKSLYEKLYDEYLIFNTVNASTQIISDLLEEYQILQNKDGHIPINANDYQPRFMPLDSSVIIEE